MGEVELKPCPFCGESVEIATKRKDYYELVGENGGAAVRISCKKCDANMWDLTLSISDYEKRVELITKKWNRRAEEWGDMKIEPLKRYCFKDNVSFKTETLIGGPRVTRAHAQLCARVMEMSDEVIVKACVDAAREAGITDLYLLDKKFVLDALKEKLQNANEHENYCQNCGARTDKEK